MADPTSYLLSFDFSDLIDEISEVEHSYTEFGKAIRSTIADFKTDLASLQDTLEEYGNAINQATTQTKLLQGIQQSGMLAMVGSMEKFSDLSRGVKESLSGIASMDMSALGGIVGAKDDKDTVAERLGDIMPGAAEKAEEGSGADAATKAAELATERAEQALRMAKRALGEVEETEQKAVSASQRVADRVKKELESGKQSMMSTLTGSIPGGAIGGGLVASLIGLMVLGTKESQRKGAERGEMLNAFEAATDAAFGQGLQKATQWFSDFQEKAQYQYGIGRKEVQRNVKLFIDAGLKTGEMLKTFDASLGEVGSNIPTMTLALDKHFNLQTGATAQRVMTGVAEYGDSLEESTRKQMEFAMAGQRSGIGVSKFVDAIMAGGQALTQYGIDLDDVAQAMAGIQKHYEAMGLDKQYAGTMAAKAVQGVAEGVANLSEGFKGVLAMRMSPGKGFYESIVEFDEGWRRVVAGTDEGFYDKMISSLSATLDDVVKGGGRAERITYLRQSGFNLQAASSLVDAAESFKKGAKVDGDEKKKQIAALKEAFKTEGQQLTDLQKTQRDLIDALAKIGQGVLKMLGGLLAAVVTGIRALIKLPEAMMKPWKFEEIMKGPQEQFEKAIGSVVEGGRDIWGSEEDDWGGLGDLGKALKGSLGAISKPLSESLDDYDEEKPTATDHAVESLWQFARGTVLAPFAADDKAIEKALKSADLAIQDVRSSWRDRDLEQQREALQQANLVPEAEEPDFPAAFPAPVPAGASSARQHVARQKQKAKERQAEGKTKKPTHRTAEVKGVIAADHLAAANQIIQAKQPEAMN